MGNSYVVRIGEDKVAWKDGRFQSVNGELISKIKAAANAMEQMPFISVNLDGTPLYSGKGINLERSWAGSYALLQELADGKMSFVSGDKPTWDALGYQLEDQAVP